MITQNTLARLRQGALVTAAVLAVAACQDRETSSLLEPTDLVSGDAALSLVVPSFTAGVGDQVAVGLRATGPVAIGGVEGTLRFDAARLRFIGQVAEAGTPVILNTSEAARGRIKAVSVKVDGFGDGNVAVFAFEVLASDFTRGLRFDGEKVASLDRERLSFRSRLDIGLADLPAVRGATVLSRAEWAEFLAPGIGEERPMLVPGDAAVYGDVNSGGSVNVFDVLDAANLNVGNESCGTLFDCVAANVEPINGGVGGACLPGYDDCATGTASIDVFDVLAIAQDNVGNPDHPVSGVAIPGGANPVYGAGDTVSINAFFGSAPGFGPDIKLTGTIHLTNDKLWTLQRTILIGDEAGAAGTLIVDPGTRVEGKDSTSILITRNGRVEAIGNPFNPIIFTCYDDGTTPGSSLGHRAPGCWGGFLIAGNAKINEGNTVASPVIPGRNGGGALARLMEGYDAIKGYAHGGDNDADNSGTLKYVVFAWGGFTLLPANELNNLTVNSCGSGTTIDYIEIIGGADDGFELFGGRCNLRHIYLQANDDDEFDYSFGFDGNIQHVVIRQEPKSLTAGYDEHDTGFEVDNTETAGTYTATGPGGVPGRTMAQVWNVTYVDGPRSDTIGTKYANYRRGAGSLLGNHLIVNAATVFDVDEAASCELLPGGVANNPPTLEMRWTNSIVMKPSTGAQALTTPGANCAGTLPLLATYVNDSLKVGSIGKTGSAPGTIDYRAYAGELPTTAWDPYIVDVKPTVTTMIGTTPPAGLDPTTYIGGVDPNPGKWPWYFPWVRGGLAGAITPF